MSAVILPRLDWVPTHASSLRHGAAVELVVIHRWGVRYTTATETAIEYRGVVNYFKDPANRASAHVVYPGSAVAGEATQMVRWDEAAWAEAAYNAEADEIESADAIWLGGDPAGLRQLARIAAFRLHVRGLPANWSTRRGLCRHADLGAAGGGHLECPTTNLTLWRTFVGFVRVELERGGFRKAWGR